MYFDGLSFLEDERDAWRPYEALEALSDDQLARPVAAAHGWSGRELIAHLVGWQETALAAARDLDIDLARSWMVGDKPCDAGAGRAAGCRTLLVRTGHGAELAGGVDDLAAAAAIVLQSRGRGPAA